MSAHPPPARTTSAAAGPLKLTARDWRCWLLTDLPLLAIAILAALTLPAGQSFDLPAAIALVALFVVAYNVRVPLGHGLASASQPVFVAMLVLEPARVATLMVLVASVLGELVAVAARSRPIGRLPMVVGNSWFAVAPTVIVALAPSPVPWGWWLAAFAAQFAADASLGQLHARLAREATVPWRVLALPELFDAVVTAPVLFACVQARGQAAAWVVPMSLVAMSALIARERSGRVANEQLASEDPLTGLPNRRLFEQLLRSAEARAERGGRNGAVLVVDLDGFKAVNDAFGHVAGDGVLREVARRLSAVVRAGDVVARVGGDEFALLLSDDVGAARVVDAIAEAFSEPVLAGSQRCQIGASVGWATFGRGAPAIEAVEEADHAMYERKRAAGHARA
ncbi:MAG: diguanylate cyclase [Solirubrobacteraceae bacterium]|nr:diguanylate cyclase [Solirubrobacteraceae bacterium]MEA2138816.1 diguanylate cyclase [Solirubrobacteraceae bacterium]